MGPRTILIPITLGESYPEQLKRRLLAYHISNREICDEIGWKDTAFSRIFRVVDGRHSSPGIDTVVAIEVAIAKIRAQREKEIAALEGKTARSR